MDDDLSHRDLSDRAVSEMSPEEKRELKRRFQEFVDVMRTRSGEGAVAPQPTKRVVKWDPAVHGSRR